LILQFKKIQNDIKGDQKIAIIFIEARLASISIDFKFNERRSTLDIIYRGRFEQSGEAKELTEAGERYFYFIFENGYSFEVYSKKARFTSNYSSENYK
jgi:hypothetical protein